MARNPFTWTVHGDGRTVRPGEVVAPHERLSWPRTMGVGAQHVVAMAGATFIVPMVTGFPAATTLFFSGLGTILFLLITANRMPSYLGSSFAFIAPIGAAMNSHGPGGALGGVVMAGLALTAVGAIVQVVGHRWIQVMMPPLVTGAIVALIGLNLAGAAWDNTQAGPVSAVVTIVAIVLTTVLFKGLLGRLSILLGLVAGYVVAAIRGEVDWSTVKAEPWVGLPEFHTPEFHVGVVGLFIPVVLVLIAENVGHIKSVSAMTRTDLDPVTGRALMADGLATTLAGSGGGSGTTTYAENIGVMAATKVYSTAAYWVAAIFALTLSFIPKVGAAVAAVPPGVLGGAATVLYGLIALLGARIWVENRVSFSNPINLTAAAVGIIVGTANYTWVVGDLVFEGIAMGTGAVLVLYHGMRAINRFTGAVQEERIYDEHEKASPLG